MKLHTARTCVLALRLGRSLTLGDLPSPALDRMREHLDPTDVVCLHLATGAPIPAVQQQVKMMRFVYHCAHHWLRLSQRLLPPSKQLQVSPFCGVYTFQKVPQQSSPYSKHHLLETLHSQISHVNDVAALVYHWSSWQPLSWLCQGRRLPEIDHICLFECGHLEALNKQIHHALSLRHTGNDDDDDNVVDDDDDHDRKDPDNKASEFTLFDIHLGLCYTKYVDKLLFICALYRLQQLQPEAVLARLPGIFSRCCRLDLLLVTRVLCLEACGPDPTAHAEYLASRQEVPSTDILTAFGQSEPYVREVVSTLSAVQREGMMACVRLMVDT